MSETPIFDELKAAFGAPRDRSKYPEGTDVSSQAARWPVGALQLPVIQITPETAYKLMRGINEAGKLPEAVQEEFWSQVGAKLDELLHPATVITLPVEAS